MNPIDLRKQEVLNKINLRKDELKKIILTKKELTNQVSRVVLCLDMSGSMENEYRNGNVQSLVEKILPIAMEFDDDGVLELVLFSNDAKYVGGVSVDNIHDFVKKEVLPHCRFGGTNYSNPINLLANKVIYDYMDGKNRRLPEFKDYSIDPLYSNYVDIVTDKKDNYPLYVIFVTDGANGDRHETDIAIKKLSKLPVFLQFVGLGDSSSFNYLETLDTMDGRYVDNANFFSSLELLDNDDSKVVSKTRIKKDKSIWKMSLSELWTRYTTRLEDSEIIEESEPVSTKTSELYNKLLAEYPDWLKKAQEKNLIS